VLIILTLLFFLATNLIREAAAVLARMEADAAILALSVFVFVTCRVWFSSKRRFESKGLSDSPSS
jgi:hypothetical protein